jgi:uncharacterized protein
MNEETIKAFVIAGHGNLETIKTMLLEHPDLLEAAHEWREGDFETALQAASHVGNADIALFLLSQGAKLEITTAAMLGDTVSLEKFLVLNPEAIKTTGAHGISLLTHAVMSENPELIRDLITKGATEGSSMALNIAVDIGQLEVIKVLLEQTQPELSWKNMKGKTVMDLAADNPEIKNLLIAHSS